MAAGELTPLELAAQRYREAHKHALQLQPTDGIAYVERIEQCSRTAGQLLRVALQETNDNAQADPR